MAEALITISPQTGPSSVKLLLQSELWSFSPEDSLCLTLVPSLVQ